MLLKSNATELSPVASLWPLALMLHRSWHLTGVECNLASFWILLYLATKTTLLQRNMVDQGESGRRDRLESEIVFCVLPSLAKVAVLRNFDGPKPTIKYGSCFILQKHNLGK